jgi:hypothetical protein
VVVISIRRIGRKLFSFWKVKDSNGREWRSKVSDLGITYTSSINLNAFLFLLLSAVLIREEGEKLTFI